LFGPGVTEVTKANVINGMSVSVHIAQLLTNFEDMKLRNCFSA